ncbi:hypothetical protein BACINT_03253 [Bacteroides intestinalis DSM 17393]|uniref:Uncharacterized protein n=1 Tax=Bacteroides intestinalis DSM 17393 TaxID=471870 RepID=B3CIR4_9BACE|nr:hypothetical protein BACINT_03253 [Bacteroides intestinalis DSM 17393]
MKNKNRWSVYAEQTICNSETDGLFVVNRPSVLEIMNYFIKLI